MNITVVGAGYVGLSVAMLLDGEPSNNVTVVDVDEQKVALLNQRVSPIADEDIERAIGDARFVATIEDSMAYKNADYVIVAVPTNYDDFQGKFDLRIVDQVVRAISDSNPNAKIVIKSTIPIGYTDKLTKHCANVIMFSPEFLREGRALHDNLFPSRIIVGCRQENHNSAMQFAEMIRDAGNSPDANIMIMGTREAEAVKLFANTFLALRVSYFNELDSFAIDNGMDAKSIIQGVCADPRIGDYYNNPSFGYGGYCLPKDTKQLLSNYCRTPQDLISAVVCSNATRKSYIADQILAKANRVAKGSPITIGIYRLVMKSGSDNFRESAVFDIIPMLEVEGVEVVIYEPLLESREYCGNFVERNFERFVEMCDVIVANRVDDLLSSVDLGEKLFTRDVYSRD